MKTLETHSFRGNIGMIVLLLVLLVVGFLVMKNFQATGNLSVGQPGQADQSATTMIDKFKGDAKRIEELNNPDLPPLEPAK